MEPKIKKLEMRYSSKDLSHLMGVSYATFRNELAANHRLKQRLHDMGWQPYKRFRKNQVLEIFKTMGYPDGYEWCEKTYSL